MKTNKRARRRKFMKRVTALVVAASLLVGQMPGNIRAQAQDETMIQAGEYLSGDCKITYKETSSWGNYVNADIVIENKGDEIVDNWAVTFSYDAQIQNIWNADILSSENGVYVIGCKEYNASVYKDGSVSFGFTACGTDGKPMIPEKIELVGTSAEETQAPSEEPESTPSPTVIPEYKIPEKWKGLEYAVFTSGEQDLSLYTNQTEINGSVHSNESFYYQGNTLHINGNLETVDTIDIRTSSGESSLQISSQTEDADTVEMPDVTKEIRQYIESNGKIYSEDKDFQSNRVVVDQSVLVEGNMTFHATQFLGEGILYADDSIIYNVGEASTPDNSRVFMAAQNGNITLNGSDISLNAILYAPNGCVQINANSFNLNGRIIAKQLIINGTTIRINAGAGDLGMLDFLFQSEAKIEASGQQKMNRKVVLDLKGIESDSIEAEDISWTFYCQEEEVTEGLLFDDDVSNQLHKELLFKEAGTYTVVVNVVNNETQNTIEKELVIEEDLPPVAGFELSDTYFERNSEGVASISLQDHSCSPDGDTIGQRIWTVYYDENNDGIYQEEEAEVIDDSNKESVCYRTGKVGKYKVYLTVVETYENTIPKLLKESDYLKDTTEEKLEAEAVFEVGNQPPKAKIELSKEKSADIVFTVGDVSQEKLELYKEKTADLEEILKKQGIDAKVDTVSTSTLKAQDTFAWKEFDHYNYKDPYLPTIEKHILYEGDSIRMVGYGKKQIRDFLYVEDDDPGQKIFEFDLQRDKDDWHSMDGGGFLFNASVSEEENKINGFALLVSSEGLKLIWIKSNNLKRYRDGNLSYSSVCNGRVLRTYKIDNLYDEHHLKIQVDKKTISVWDGERLVINNYVLPEHDNRYGFGPIICHKSHACDQCSYFTFRNITMTTTNGTSLSDIVEGYDWRPEASHYVINLSDESVPELSSAEEMSDLAAALIKNDASFIGLGNENNENQYRSLLNTAQTGGVYLSTKEASDTEADIEDADKASILESVLEQVNTYLEECILAKDYSIGDSITTDTKITYNGYYEDPENDPLYEQQWEYEYDPNAFGTQVGEVEHIIRKENNPITVFEDTGAYLIRLKVRDNPTGENDALDEYRKWSDEAEAKELLLVQSRPVASVKAEAVLDEKDKTKCIVNVSYTASDADHENEKAKGIRKEEFYYKNSQDGEWTKGKLPNKLEVGQTYLVKYIVTDVEGTQSFPAVAVIKTNELRVYEEIEDTVAPEVFLSLSKQEINLGEEIQIEGYAEDDYGVDLFELFIDGEKVMDYFGRVLYTPEEEGTVVIKAVATDIGGNRTEKEIELKVTDNRDKTAPTAEIISPNDKSDVGEQIEFIGTVKDETSFDKYTLSYRKQGEEAYTEFASGEEEIKEGILGTLDVSRFTDGIYEIRLESQDSAGNISYTGLLLHVENGIKEEKYTLTADMTRILLNEEGQIEIYGTVSTEGRIKEYTLQYQNPQTEEIFELAKGTADVEDALIGKLETDSLESGTYALLLTVWDNAGNQVTATGSFEYTIQEGEEGQTPAITVDINAPEISVSKLAIDQEKNEIAIFGTIRDDIELKDYALSYAIKGSESYQQIATGTKPVEEDYLAGIPLEGLESGEYELCLLATDAYGNRSILKQTISYTKGSEQAGDTEETEPEVALEKEQEESEGGFGEGAEQVFGLNLTHSTVAIGTELTAVVTLPSNVKKEDVTILLDGEVISKGEKKTTLKIEEAGEHKVVAKAVTAEGEALKVEKSCYIYNPNDKNHPTASISTPTADTILTEPVDIVGSAYDAEEMEYYSLEYRMVGADTYVEIARSHSPKQEEVLGQLDTTMLMNGQYEVRLTVMDKGGNIRSIVRTYEVDGNLKIGNMSIGFTDITSVLGGTTINVNRMYDSRNKAKGDFGIGWTLGMQGMTLTENEPLYDGFEMLKTGAGFSRGYYMKETKNHDVIIDYGDGTSDRFQITFSPERRALVPIYSTKLGYKCVTNPKVKLEILEDTTGVIGDGFMEFAEEAIYDRKMHYKLTNEDGIEIYLTAEAGVSKIIDNNDNVIKVTDNGYEASNGKGITFTRDGQNRISEAKDPNGNVTSYAYDDCGNLTSVTDPAGRKVSFTYDEKHNLISIIDPMGIATARNEYDEAGRLVAVIDADGNRMEYDYDIEGRTQLIRDRRGNSTVYTYDNNGNILQTVDGYGNKTINTYDENNNLLSVTDANGNTTSYAYDEYNNVIEVVAADGTKVESTYTQENQVSGIQMLDKTVMAMEYDDKGRLESIEDANGNTTEYDYTSDGKLEGISDGIGMYQKVTYDEEGNVASTENGAGETASYTYDKDGRCTSVTISREEDGENLSFTSYYTYNEAGEIIQSVDNAGNITAYEYDDNGNQTASIDAKGRRIGYQYDDMGNLIKTTYPDGTFETFTYDANGNNLSATDRSGNAMYMKYDKLNRLVQKVTPDGNKETYTYDAAGNVTEQTSVTGAKTTYTYDCRNRNTSITDTYGNKSTFEYNETSQLTRWTDALGNETAYEYDDNGNIIKTIYADGNRVESEYDARNRVISQTDANGNKTKYTYDGADRLTKVTDAYGNSWTYTYDANGNLVEVEDANEHATTYTYDAVGRVVSMRNALGRTMEYRYDETGNVVEMKDYAGNVTKNTYDAYDRLVKKVVEGAAESGDSGKGDTGETTISDNIASGSAVTGNTRYVTKYAYNEAGLLTKVTDQSGNITYSYDKYNRLTGKTDARGNELKYTYDDTGRLSSFDNGFGKTRYEYDLLDRVTRVIDRNGEATVYEYDEVGNRTAVRYANGVTMSYTYDPCHRLKEEWVTDGEGNTISKYVYTLGRAGERTAIEETDVLGNETTISYTYDKLERLTEEKIQSGDNQLVNSYTYDRVSNRLSKETTVTGDVSVLADEQLDEVEIVEGKTAYTYNALNQLLLETSSKGEINYTYDEKGSLLKQTGDQTIDYSYDLEGHLLRATVQKGNKVTIESYTYDYAGNRTSKTEGDKATTYYVVDTSGSLAQVTAETDSEGKEKAYYTRGEELISMERNSQLWYYTYDGHGNVRTLTNEYGNVTDYYAYDASGNLLKKSGGTENDFLYTGEQYNAATGLYYLRARYMDPSTGTFISMDSYQGSLYDPVSLHKYLYANANPVKYTDPTGYCVAIGATLALASDGAEQMSRFAVLMNLKEKIINLFIISTTVVVVSANYLYVVNTALSDGSILETATDLAEKVKEKAVVHAKSEDDLNKGAYAVYTLKDNEGNVRYVGRTIDYKKRIAAHRRPKGKIYEYGLKEGEVYEGLTWFEARGLEQTLMYCYHTLNLSKETKDNPNVNFVNCVSPKHSDVQEFYKDTIKYINRYPSYFENQIDNEINNLKESMGVWW